MPLGLSRLAGAEETLEVIRDRIGRQVLMVHGRGHLLR
jgi:hypothetical protein